MNKDVKRITKEQDKNDRNQQIFRPAEKFSKPIDSYWILIWLIIIALTVVAWMFLFVYFSHHQAPFAAPLK